MKVQLVLQIAISALRVAYSQLTQPNEENCSQQRDGNLRLVHTQGWHNFGALQVCDSEFGWRYFINTDWTIGAARLACRQLKLDYLSPTTGTLRLSSGVHIRRIERCSCIETAQYIDECIEDPDQEHNVVLTVNCSNGDLPRQECSTGSVVPNMNECTNGSIRLVGGVHYNEGRVEICLNNVWGTVCGEGWTERDVGHMCNRLGYPMEGAKITSYGEGSGPIYNITCFIDTSDSPYAQVIPSNCNHSLDLGVRCQTYLTVFRAVCETEINERLSSLTTAMPRECPTQLATTTRINLTEMTQCPLCNTNSETPTEAIGLGSEGSRNTLNKSNTSILLAAFLGLLGVILAIVLAGWIMTCVYFKYKTNRQAKSINVPVSSSDSGLNNPVYDMSAPPSHTIYSSLGPSYETNQGGIHEYNVLSRSHPQNRPHPSTPLPGLQDHEYSVLDGPAHTPGGSERVVEEANSLVGESDPQDYKVPTPAIERQGKL